MTFLNITPSEEVQAVSVNGPATLDGTEIRTILDAADAAIEVAKGIGDPVTAEAIRQLGLGLNAAGVLLLGVASGIHRRNIAVINYPEGL